MAHWSHPRVEFETSSGEWTNITPYVRTVARAVPANVAIGRQTELADPEPSRLTMTLDNTDHRFTLGYAGGAYGSEWTQGRRIRVVEYLDGRAYPTFTGYLEMPEVETHPAAVDNLVTVTAVDLLGYMETAYKFRGVLYEHIRANGGTALKAYWPMDDGTDTFREVIAGNTPLTWSEAWSSLLPLEGESTVTPGTGSGPPADDGGAARIECAFGDFAGDDAIARSPRVEATLAYPIDMELGDVVTFVVWVNPDDFPDEDMNGPLLSIQRPATGTQIFGRYSMTRYSRFESVDRLSWALDGALSGMTGEIHSNGSCAEAPVEVAYPIAIRIQTTNEDGTTTVTGAEYEIWVGSRRYKGTPAGTVSADKTRIGYVRVCSIFSGSVAHAQLYVGPSDAFTYEDYLAQMELGNIGHDRQRTDERIRMTARYAGVPDGLLDLDEGAAYLPAVTLAGRTPADVWREAAATERGRLYVDGEGRLVLKSRETTYDI